MNLSCVTITGADHTIDVSALKDIAAEFPFVEWGILFSSSKQGCNYRYPREEWLESLREYKDLNLSAHLCGKWVIELTDPNSSFTFVNYLDGIYSIFKRMQLNMTDDRFVTLDIRSLFNIQELLDGFPKVILQTKRSQKELDAYLLDIEMANLNLEPFFELLYDPSGGKGKQVKKWPKPTEFIPFGYAGGLNPDNIEEQLVRINEAAGDATVWIDMETGVRTDDKFDLDKVRKCLELAKPYVHT